MADTKHLLTQLYGAFGLDPEQTPNFRLIDNRSSLDVGCRLRVTGRPHGQPAHVQAVITYFDPEAGVFPGHLCLNRNHLSPEKGFYWSWDLLNLRALVGPLGETADGDALPVFFPIWGQLLLRQIAEPAGPNLRFRLETRMAQAA